MSKFRFEEIAINSTEKKKPVESDKYTYLGLEHLDPGTLKVSRFGSDVAPIGEKLVMKKGDVLFGKRRAYQKKVAIAPFDGIFSAHGMVLRPKTEVIDSEFFPLFISSDYFLDAAIKISVGSLSPTINWKDLKKLEFELPDLETQRQLAKVLWALIDTIENYKILMTKTDELVKSQFIEQLSLEKREIRLGDIISYKAKSKIQARDGKCSGKYPLFNSSDEQTLWIDNYLYDNETIFIPTGGKAAINFFKGKCSATTDNICFSGNEAYLTKYIYLSLWSDLSILQKGFKGSGLQHISKEYVEEINIKAPDINVQNRLIEIANQSDKSKFHIRKLIQMKIAIWQKGGKIYANI